MRTNRAGFLLCLLGCLASSPLAAQSPSDPLFEARRHEAVQQYGPAADAYREYLIGNPENDDIRAALARVLSWQNQYEEAVALYEEILSRHPADHDVRVALARVRSWQGKLDEAQAGYQSVLLAEPDNPDAQRGLADTLYRNGDYAGALRLYENLSLTTDEPELPQRIEAIKTELAALTPAQTLRAPIGAGRMRPALPFRDYLKIGYSQYGYTHSIPDEHNGLIEGSTSLGTRTLVGRIEPLHRFGFHDVPVSGELYSPLWEKAWGYVGALATANPSFSPNVSFGGEIFQGLGAIHRTLSFLEPSLGYRHMVFGSTSIDVVIPGMTVYFPYNMWLTEKIYYVPSSGAVTFSTQLTWRPTDRLQFFASGSYGTSSNNIRAAQDFRRIASFIVQGGAIVPLSDRLSLETTAYYEDREGSYVRRGGTMNLIIHW
jgi:YaiO family outer membrane protein